MRPLLLAAVLLTAVTVLRPAVAAEAFETASRSYSAGMYGSAARHWREMAERGHGPAQYNIGRMFYYGQGVRRDPIEAFKWFLLAGDSGVEQGRIAARILRDKLTSRQVVEASLRAETTRRRHSR